MLARLAAVTLLALALAGCDDSRPPPVEAPRPVPVVTVSAPPPVEPPPTTLPEMYVVARLAADLVRELETHVAGDEELTRLVEHCGVPLDAIEGIDVALSPPDRFRADIHGKLPAKALTCVLDALGVQGKLDLQVEVVTGGLRVGTWAGIGDASKEVLALLDARSKVDTYVQVRLGKSPAWTAELSTSGEDIAATVHSSAEALDELHAWWTRAKATRSGQVPELKQIDLVRKGDRLALEIAGDGWDDVDKSVALAMAVRQHVVESWRVPSGSMMPTLLLGDHFFVDKTGPAPARGDVIVFRFPDNRDQSFVKRVIAQNGDQLEVLDGRPIVNGLLLPRCHVGRLTMPGTAHPLEVYLEFLAEHAYLTAHDAAPAARASCKADADCGGGQVCRAAHCGVLQGPFKAAAKEMWVLGDNRNNSHDSRSWNGGGGAGVPLADVTGRASLLYFNGTWIDRAVTRIAEPRLPVADASAQARLKDCLANRPPLAETTPPAR